MNDKIYRVEFGKFKRYFSTSRVNRYLIATGNSTEKTVKLYKANLKVAQVFHPLVCILEVVLRNTLNNVLTSHFDDPNWIINQKTGFMSDPTLRFTHKQTGQVITNDFLKREIAKAEKRLQNTRTLITSGKIIAEQTFGFWSDLFEVHHYRLLKGKPIQIFQTLPSGYGRKDIKDELDKVRIFRNRINHNEPVCFNGNVIDFTETLAVYNSIINLLELIDPELLKLISNLDMVQETIDKAQSI
ncbi:Abi family protein [uncultured Mucilaginibacter sp.]|uniref:Abi family protein n=1 Tax=uncultured Mucilaginibacter sp. TaxID=797541 RepID=UPI00263051E6|nr:Abi family protein [uncultured Mucilaginibacter sp.]